MVALKDLSLLVLMADDPLPDSLMDRFASHDGLAGEVFLGEYGAPLSLDQNNALDEGLSVRLLALSHLLPELMLNQLRRGRDFPDLDQTVQVVDPVDGYLLAEVLQLSDLEEHHVAALHVQAPSMLNNFRCKLSFSQPLSVEILDAGCSTARHKLRQAWVTLCSNPKRSQVPLI